MKHFFRRKSVWLGLLIFCGVSGYFINRKLYRQPDLTIIGYIKMADGLGRQSIELINALKDDVSINFLRTLPHDMHDVPNEIKKVLEQRYRHRGKVILFEETLSEAPHFFSTLEKSDHRIRLAYSMFESSQIPKEWVVALNHCFDAVIVPDEFLIQVYRTSGVQIPIFTLPLGLDLGYCLKQPLKKKSKDPFVFTNLSSCYERKNQVNLVRAFAKAFGNDRTVQLIINARMGDKKTIKAVQDEIDHHALENVQFSVLSLPPSIYFDIFLKTDCYVSLSKGEGFSIQPREAMALGIPVIATDNSGQSTICKSGLVHVVPSKIANPAFYHWDNYARPYGQFFDCHIDEAAAAMRAVFDHYEEYLAKGAAARVWARQYEQKNLKPLFLSLVKPKKAILGSEDKITPDYLMTTSQALFDKYQRLITD